MNLSKRIPALLLCILIMVLPAVGAAGEFETATPTSPSKRTDPVGTPSDVITEEPGEPEEPEEPEESGEPEIPDEPEETEKPAPELVLKDIPVSMSVGSKIALKAELRNFETPVAITWSSDNTAVATVDSRGVVTCVAAGSAKITASASDGETVVSASRIVNVAARRSFCHFVLSVNYSYSNMGDYYYSDNDYAWQKPFGFMRIYDVASQLIGYQYDFKRMVFTYGNKDWLIELWKGQYALFQYGGEIGVYTKYAAGFGDTAVSTYRCAAEEDWLNMEMTLNQDQTDGTIRPVFTRDYGKYWWCDGYRVGKLRDSKPAKELQMVSRITLKDEEMAQAFVESMKTSGFSQVSSLDRLTDDAFCRDGCDVYYIWRNLTESQSLIPLTINGESTGPLALIIDIIKALGEVFIGGIGSAFSAFKD